MAQPKPPDRRKKARSIGWLADIYFRDGREAARIALEAISPGDLLQNYRVVRRGEHALRTTTEQRDRIRYQSFTPPLWAWPYSVLRARFEPAEKDRFMHHGGEEILLPIEGSVAYHFFCSAGKSAPTRRLLPDPVKPGCVIRIDPQIPHHAWAGGEEPATAWMFIRDQTDSTAGTHLGVPRDVHLEVQPPRRQLSAEELEHSERYALVAWGISEKVRLGRLSAGLSIRQLAAACEIDPAQLSRIENGSSASNISLDVLLRIARCLGLDVQQLLSAEFIDEGNPFKIEEIERTPQPGVGQSILCIPERHFLHVNHWDVPEGETLHLEEEGEGSRIYRSWIVLEGEAIFELSDPMAGTNKELVDHDSVIHCRNDAVLTTIRALQNLKLLQVAYSASCSST